MPGYGAHLRELATRCGALLIAGEVTTGMGRTGRWFGFEHDGIAPGVLVIGKALGAGLPVSAVVTTQEVEAHCQGVQRHVQSHQNDPFAGRITATGMNPLTGIVRLRAFRTCAWCWNGPISTLLKEAGCQLPPTFS
ncbi:MAG: aminotransferase class III-fold pyridoxal phosphate-dependent enzyme [Chloroflexota bacterium]|nr:aminotransferase class III-fold pyridoxal phosphate-dependent enzyme [Chloroflexota bacterium]